MWLLILTFLVLALVILKFITSKTEENDGVDPAKFNPYHHNL